VVLAGDVTIWNNPVRAGQSSEGVEGEGEENADPRLCAASAQWLKLFALH